MNPLAILLALFFIVPIIEIYLLIEIGSIIGSFATIFAVVFTAVLGAWMLRVQGFATLRRLQQTAAEGGIPAMEVLEGAMLLVAGALLLTPGFFTDTIGFLCLIPQLRRSMALWFFQRIFRFPRDTSNRGFRRPRSKNDRTDAIEGEFRRDE
ncbi:MAG: FxsA family protein [Gammaproteobacteria bacterium]|nr:FxsA family protein [Gammaproteobacteria bacterium]